MKRGILIILTVIVALPAEALRHPTAKELEAIQDQINDARNMEKGVQGAEIDLVRAKDDLEAAQTKNPKGLSAQEIDALQKNKNAIAYRVERVRDEQQAAYNKAIHLTIDIYQIEPNRSGGVSVMPWTKGRHIEWMPIMRPPASWNLRAADGTVIEQKQPRTKSGEPKDYWGLTYFDGVSIIDESTFRNGPAWLAATLDHEHAHFEQYITPGIGDNSTATQREAWAYAQQYKDCVNFSDPKEKVCAWIKEQMDDNAAQAKVDDAEAKKISNRIQNVINSVVGRADLDDMYAKPLSKADYGRIRSMALEARAAADRDIRDGELSQGVDVVSQLRSIQTGADGLRDRLESRNRVLSGIRLERETQGLAQVPALPAEAPLLPARAPVIANYRRQYDLIGLATRACDQLGSISDDDVSVLSNYDRPFAGSPPADPQSECVADVYAAMLQLDWSEITASKLNAAAAAWRSRRTPVQAPQQPARRERNDDRSGSHGVPSRTWNPTFHPN